MQTQTQVESLQARVSTLEEALGNAVTLLAESYSQQTIASSLGISRWQVRQLLNG